MSFKELKKNFHDLNINGAAFSEIALEFQKSKGNSLNLNITDLIAKLMVFDRNLNFEYEDLNLFKKRFLQFLNGKFDSENFACEKDIQLKRIEEMENKLVDSSYFIDELSKLKKTLNIIDKENLIDEKDKSVIERYQILKSNVRLYETKIDLLVKEKEFKEDLVKDLNKRENEYLIKLNNHSTDEPKIEANKNFIKELQEENENLKISKQNEKAASSIQSVLLTDSEEDFFKDSLTGKSILVVKISSNQKTLKLKEAIEKIKYKLISNLFEKIDIDFKWLDKKLDSPGQLNLWIFSEATSLNNIKIKSKLVNLKLNLSTISGHPHHALDKLIEKIPNNENNNEIDFKIQNNIVVISNLEKLATDQYEWQKNDQNELIKKIEIWNNSLKSELNCIAEKKEVLSHEIKIINDKITGYLGNLEQDQKEIARIKEKAEKLTEEFNKRLEIYKNANPECYSFNKQVKRFQEYFNILNDRKIQLIEKFDFFKKSLEKNDLNEITDCFKKNNVLKDFIDLF